MPGECKNICTCMCKISSLECVQSHMIQGLLNQDRFGVDFWRRSFLIPKDAKHFF